jgi:hypothetical protein
MYSKVQLFEKSVSLLIPVVTNLLSQPLLKIQHHPTRQIPTPKSSVYKSVTTSWEQNVTFWVLHATKITGSTSDGWIYSQLLTHSLLATVHTAVQSYRSFTHFPVHRCTRTRTSVSTSRFPATDLNTQTIRVSHFKYYT